MIAVVYCSQNVWRNVCETYRFLKYAVYAEGTVIAPQPRPAG